MKSIFQRCLSHSKPASGWILETIGSKPLSHQRCNSMEFILMQSTYDRFGLPPFPVRNSHHHNFYMLRLGDPEVNLHLPRVRPGARGASQDIGTPLQPFQDNNPQSPSFCWHLTHTMESSSKSLRGRLRLNNISEKPCRFCWMGQEIWWFKVWEF